MPMPSREQMISDLSNVGSKIAMPSREQMILDLSKNSTEKMDWKEAAKLGVESSMTLGTRPTIAGLGAGAGGFVGELQSGKGLSQAWDTAKQSFSEARDFEKQREEKAYKDQPTATTLGSLGGTLVTAPLLPAKGIIGAAKLGGLYGAGQAVGHADTLGEAAEMAGTGAVLGGATAGVLKGAGYVGKKALSKAVDLFPKKTALRIMSTVSGIPEEQIADYAKRSKVINGIIKVAKGDFADRADQVKNKLNKEIYATRKRTNEEIAEALKESNKVEIYDTKPIIDKLKTVVKELDKDFNADQINEIGDIIKTVSTKGNTVNLEDLFRIKTYLQDQASRSFLKQGQIFSRGKDAQRASKYGYLEAKKILDEVSPAIKAANSKLHKLHVLEDSMNKNLIKEGAPEAALLAGGAGLNRRNENVLKELGKLTGYDVLDEAKKLSTARAFTNPRFVPEVSTGRSLTLLLTGATLGGAISSLSGYGYEKGALIAGALSSPLAIKSAINAGRVSSELIGGTLKMLSDPKVQSVLVREGIDAVNLKKTIDEFDQQAKIRETLNKSRSK